MKIILKNTSRKIFKKRVNYFLVKEFPNIYLTERQMDCLKLILKNYKQQEIAHNLGISSRTVELHLVALRHKFDVPRTSYLKELIKNPNFVIERAE